jgi:hypothetical protein
MSCSGDLHSGETLAVLHQEKCSAMEGSTELLIYLMNCVPYLRTGDLDGWKREFDPQEDIVIHQKRLRQSPSAAPILPMDKCKGCGSDDVIDDVRQGQWVCIACGLIQQLGVCTADSAHSSYDRLTNTARVYIHRYSRIIHFKAVISQLTGTSRPQLPADVKSRMQAALAGQDITVKTVVCMLRKEKLNRRYRRHAVSIAGILRDDIDSSEIDATVFYKMMKLFRRVEFFFDKHRRRICPKRKVFFSYKFILYQFSKELGYPVTDDYLLKSPALLQYQQYMYRELTQYTTLKCYD